MSESEEEYPETAHEDEEEEEDDEEEEEEGDGTAESQSDAEAEPEFKSPPVGDVSGGKLTSKESLANLISASEPIKIHAKPGHPKTADMVRFALVTMKERNGSSMQAIKKYISANYLVDATKIAPFLKKYVKAAVESGVLIQTKGKGATGSFKLNAVAAKKAVKKQKSTEDGDVVDEPKKKAKKVVKEKVVKEKVVKDKVVKEKVAKDKKGSNANEKKPKATAAKKKVPVKAQSSVEQSPSPKKATAGRKKAASAAPDKEPAKATKAKKKTTAVPKTKKDKEAVAETKAKDKKSPKKKAPAKKK